MGLAKFIISAVLSVIFLYFTITSIQNFMEAQKEVKKAQKEVEEAQKEMDNTVKYGCPNPEKMGELVMCP
jgi:uncharacterized membrane protein (DUF106 family)